MFLLQTVGNKQDEQFLNVPLEEGNSQILYRAEKRGLDQFDISRYFVFFGCWQQYTVCDCHTLTHSTVTLVVYVNFQFSGLKEVYLS